MKTLPGDPSQLGATSTSTGVNFAVYSEHADAVWLCLFDPQESETARLPLTRTENTWSIAVPKLDPGQRYGYRAAGTHDPTAGCFFDPNKLLIDPYAKCLTGPLKYDARQLSQSHEDSASCVPKCVVVPTAASMPRAASRPLHKSVIFEAHVKGLTYRHPLLPDALRGTYLGLAHPEIIQHLKSLGVTSVELLPVNYHIDEPHLVDNGLTNYWGYNTLAFFAPDGRYASSPGRANEEFLTMVRALHDAGLEVLLDVVFNHTAEGGADGRSLSFRGLDNPTYYALADGQFINDTGCGNTVNTAHPAVQRLVVDCLKYWSQEMEVDGFRFDLAPVLGRTPEGYDPMHPLLAAIDEDPELSRRTMIAEPWDVGPGGYQLGNFPPRWGEWNDQYRDAIRAFWRGDSGSHSAFAGRLRGSADLFEPRDKSPSTSINFITAHDGFTLHDLVAYNHKHNEANGEQNRDGHNENLSDNCGVEGCTTDPAVSQLRHKRQRAMLATLLLSQGTPMLLAGDEMSHSQQGNNNAYCQDNQTTWLTWRDSDDLGHLIARACALRGALNLFADDRHVHDSCQIDDPNMQCVAWFTYDGHPMEDHHWHADHQAFTVLWQNPNQQLLLAFNNTFDEQPLTLPTPIEHWSNWLPVLDSSATGGRPTKKTKDLLPAQSMCAFTRNRADEAR